MYLDRLFPLHRLALFHLLVPGLLLSPLLLSPTLVWAQPPSLPVPVPPQRAPGLMKLPEGFHASLVAGEPDLVKPIAMALDDRGRLWVVESHSYPKWLKDGQPGKGKDRVLIFEHDHKTGRFHSAKVFLDNGTNLSGIALGHGGVWLTAVPNLIFIPVKPGEDRPAGPARVVLDGWDLSARHNVVNGLIWGPDGWLWGLNGILSNSLVGAPGTPVNKRVRFNCGVWRYHPIRRTFEVVAHGTTNPWGLDFDDHGEAFITNCVIKHLFHVVPGAHLVRMFGQDMEPHSYKLLESIADHIHWAGGSWTSSRGGKGEHSAAGGGHAHAGAMIYLGDNWPERYRNRVFMCNIHGNRINMDELRRRGSGYVALHGEDFLLAQHDWFRALNLLYGPDGGVFINDWHDTGECHNYEVTQPAGRIFKVLYGKPRPITVDLSREEDLQLVERQLHRNDWYVRHARRLLQERSGRGELSARVQPALQRLFKEEREVTRRLRALWALHAIGATTEEFLSRALDDRQPEIRRWAVRLLGDYGAPSPAVVRRWTTLAKEESDASVRLALASGLQRLPLEQRWELGAALASRAEDAQDAYLPLMIWYGIEPLAATDAQRAARLLASTRIPLVRQYLARRIAVSAE